MENNNYKGAEMTGPIRPAKQVQTVKHLGSAGVRETNAGLDERKGSEGADFMYNWYKCFKQNDGGVESR